MILLICNFFQLHETFSFRSAKIRFSLSRSDFNTIFNFPPLSTQPKQFLFPTSSRCHENFIRYPLKNIRFFVPSWKNGASSISKNKYCVFATPSQSPPYRRCPRHREREDFPSPARFLRKRGRVTCPPCFVFWRKSGSVKSFEATKLQFQLYLFYPRLEYDFQSYDRILFCLYSHRLSIKSNRHAIFLQEI